MENTDNEILNYFDSYMKNNIYKQNKLEKYIYIYIYKYRNFVY